jgi:putative phosphoesterase
VRIGVVADAHGNIGGLDAALAAMGEVDQLLFAGDFLGYYFDAVGVVERLRARRAECVLGNHDVYFLSYIGRLSFEVSGIPDRMAYRARYGPALERAAAELSSEHIDWLAQLPSAKHVACAGKKLLLTHGSPWNEVHEYIYPDRAAFDDFAAVDASVVVMGHTHYPLSKRSGHVHIVNPGSCGQPRDGDPHAAFSVITMERDEAAISVALHRTPFDRTVPLLQCKRIAPDVPLLTDLLTREARR